MRLRSRITTDGLDRTPHRAFMRAMGLDDAAIGKAMIGVVSQKGETTPCSMTHGVQVDAAKDGVAAADRLDPLAPLINAYCWLLMRLTGASRPVFRLGTTPDEVWDMNLLIRASRP